MQISKVFVTVCLVAVMCCLVMSQASASGTAPQTLKFHGTIQYINLEGGFWGIVSDEGKNYDPINLAQEYRQKGLRVQVEAVPTNRVGFHMWGTIVEIKAITVIVNQK